MRPVHLPDDFIPHSEADKVLSIGDEYSFKRHGHWVRHKTTGEEGRICWTDSDRREVMVYWGLYKKKASACAVEQRELILLKREPEPWYDFHAIERRRLKNA